jgi:phage terminase small subunit
MCVFHALCAFFNGKTLLFPNLATSPRSPSFAGMADEEKDQQLTEKEEAFCQQYLIDFNGARAAREAGYSVDSAREIAHQNLSKLHIQARIAQLREATGKAFNITRERIAQELALIAFGDTKVLYDENGRLKTPENWSEEGRLVSSYEETVTTGGEEGREWEKKSRKVRSWEKTKALEQLARLMGYNEPEKRELMGLLQIQQITGMEIK